VQVVRRLMAAFNQRDVEDLLELVDQHVEFFAPQTALSVDRNSSYQGHEGIRQYFDDVDGVWTALEVIPKEFRSADLHVVVLGTVTGERDGESVNGEVAWAWKLRDGRVVWGRVYQDPGEALQDAGIG
jgi:ketosteroid isomerase-like protein